MLPGMTKTAIAIRHVPFEDLGILEGVLTDAGYEVRYLEAGLDQLGRRDGLGATGPGTKTGLDPAQADLLVVLGGPIGACEEDRYPFLAAELRTIERRLEHAAPTLGVCLGAQLMARSLGARIYPGTAREIGWGDVRLTELGLTSPLRHLEAKPVLHWHGDTFDLPSGAELLASTDAYPNQAFRIGASVLALQFHAEVVGANLERWLIGHAAELATAGIDPRTLRAETARSAAGLEEAGRRLFAEWLSGLDARP
jgi:GMP synthase (glutamine-hydrolysing)